MVSLTSEHEYKMLLLKTILHTSVTMSQHNILKNCLIVKGLLVLLFILDSSFSNRAPCTSMHIEKETVIYNHWQPEF